MARQGDWPWSHGQSGPWQHIDHDYKSWASLDGPCNSHGLLPHPTSVHLWGTCAGTQTSRAAKETLQRLRLRKPEIFGRCCSRAGTQRQERAGWRAATNRTSRSMKSAVKNRSLPPETAPPSASFQCSHRPRVCASIIGLTSHPRTHQRWLHYWHHRFRWPNNNNKMWYTSFNDILVRMHRWNHCIVPWISTTIVIGRSGCASGFFPLKSISCSNELARQREVSSEGTQSRTHAHTYRP